MLGISIVCGSLGIAGTSNEGISAVGMLGISIVCGILGIVGTSKVGIVCSVDEELVSVSDGSSKKLKNLLLCNSSDSGITGATVPVGFNN